MLSNRRHVVAVTLTPSPRVRGSTPRKPLPTITSPFMVTDAGRWGGGHQTTRPLRQPEIVLRDIVAPAAPLVSLRLMPAGVPEPGR